MTETHPLDEDRDPASAAVVRAFAAEVAAQHGGDLRGMRRALGISNATWVGGGLAVRIANAAVVDGMAAEVALVRAPVMRQQAQPSGQTVDGLIGLRQEVIDRALQ